LHKHHLIIRVGAGLIQFVYGSHSRLAADLTLDKNLFSLPFSRRFSIYALNAGSWKKTCFFDVVGGFIIDAIAAHQKAPQPPKHPQTARKTDLRNGIQTSGGARRGSGWLGVVRGG